MPSVIDWTGDSRKPRSNLKKPFACGTVRGVCEIRCARGNVLARVNVEGVRGTSERCQPRGVAIYERGWEELSETLLGESAWGLALYWQVVGIK